MILIVLASPGVDGRTGEQLGPAAAQEVGRGPLCSGHGAGEEGRGPGVVPAPCPGGPGGEGCRGGGRQPAGPLAAGGGRGQRAQGP